LFQSDTDRGGCPSARHLTARARSRRQRAPNADRVGSSAGTRGARGECGRDTADPAGAVQADLDPVQDATEGAATGGSCERRIREDLREGEYVRRYTVLSGHNRARRPIRRDEYAAGTPDQECLSDLADGGRTELAQLRALRHR